MVAGHGVGVTTTRLDMVCSYTQESESMVYWYSRTQSKQSSLRRGTIERQGNRHEVISLTRWRRDPKQGKLKTGRGCGRRLETGGLVLSRTCISGRHGLGWDTNTDDNDVTSDCGPGSIMRYSDILSSKNRIRLETRFLFFQPGDTLGAAQYSVIG